MKTVFTRVIQRRLLSIMLIAIFSCDSFEEEEKQINFSQTEFFTLPGSSIVIDLKSVMKVSYASASLQVTRNPTRGALSRDISLFKYKPSPLFKEGTDEFTISAMENGEILKSQTITVTILQDIAKFPCGLNAMEDSLHVVPGSTVSVNFLENDLVCGTDPSDLHFSIHSGPRHGDAVLAGNTIVYTPWQEFAGEDELIYKISSSAGDKISYGIVTITDNWSFRAQQLPGTYLSHIFFLDEQIGYASGLSGFFKTTDGGRHWEDVQRPPLLMTQIGDPRHFQFEEIFFLDVDHGYTIFREYFDGGIPSESSYGDGGLMATKDGGTSWEVKLQGSNFTSVFFTSSTTGFVSEFSDAPGFPPVSRIFKTTDGGQSWRKVFEIRVTQYENKFLNVRFANATNGYAYAGNKLFVSNDEGETWQMSDSNRYIFSLAAASDNIVVGAYAPEWELPGSIFRWKGVSQRITDFDYEIRNIEFSPSGNEGFALGFQQTLDSYSTVHVYRTDDQGLTWKEQPGWEEFNGYWDISVPSDDVAYVLSKNGLMKYSNP